MRKLIVVLMLVFSVSGFGQNDSIKKVSIVSADKMNVVYRGLPNPVSISAGGKPFTASGIGLQKKDDGKYYLIPGNGTETFVHVTYKNDDGTTSVEKHTFRIKNIKHPNYAINGNVDCRNCNLRFTKDELKDAVISLEIPELMFNWTYKVTRFSVRIPGFPDIEVNGNKFNKEVMEALVKAKTGDKILIYHIGTSDDTEDEIILMHTQTPGIIFEIYKPKIVRFKPSKEQRDSIRIQRKQERLLKRKTSQN